MIDKPGPAEDAIVITGASTGIGRASALHLDGLGYPDRLINRRITGVPGKA